MMTTASNPSNYSIRGGKPRKTSPYDIKVDPAKTETRRGVERYEERRALRQQFDYLS